MLAQKGEGAAAEVTAAAHALAELGGGGATLTTVQLPETEEGHVLVVVDKIRPTPIRYPRRPGIPAKRPL